MSCADKQGTTPSNTTLDRRTAAALSANAEAQAQTTAAPIGSKPPNILVIWGDDFGTWNISTKAAA